MNLVWSEIIENWEVCFNKAQNGILTIFTSYGSHIENHDDNYQISLLKDALDASDLPEKAAIRFTDAENIGIEVLMTSLSWRTTKIFSIFWFGGHHLEF